MQADCLPSTTDKQPGGISWIFAASSLAVTATDPFFGQVYFGSRQIQGKWILGKKDGLTEPGSAGGRRWVELSCMPVRI